MFTKRKRDAARILELQEQLDAVIRATAELQSRAYLVAIQRENRMNKFVFARGEKLFAIETMGMLSDDVQQWRKDLGI